MMKKLDLRHVIFLILGLLACGVFVSVIVKSWMPVSLVIVLSGLVLVFWCLRVAASGAVVLREIRTELRSIRALNKQHALAIDELSNRQEQMQREIAMRMGTADSATTEGTTGQDRSDGRAVGDRDANSLVELNEDRIGASSRELLNAVLTADEKISKTKMQLNRTVRRQVEIYGMLEFIEGKITARIDQFLNETQLELRKNRAQVDALSKKMDLHRSPSLVASSPRSAEDERFSLEDYLYFLSYHVPKEVEAIVQLRAKYKPDLATPLLGGWALTPTGTFDITNTIARDRPEVVVECGSGSSTVWLALAARDAGCGHVYALEHDPSFAETTRVWLSDLGLSQFATVIDAPIVEHDVPGGAIRWYDVVELGWLSSLDMLIVDGPPQSLGQLRGGALELLLPKFSGRVHVFADDVNRKFESELIDHWLAEYEEFDVAASPTPVQAHLIWTSKEDL